MSALLNIPMHQIDEEGDVLASCEIPNPDQNEAVLGYLKLSSRALSLASPVFREMCKPPNNFQASQTSQNDVKQIKLLVESFESAIVIMRIIHHRNSLIPTSVTSGRLYEVASFADRYMCQEALSLAMNFWIPSLWAKRQEESVIGEQKISLRWLWIAKVFKRREILQSFAKSLVFNIRLVRGNYLFHEKDTNTLHPSMESFAEAIWDERQHLLAPITKMIEERIKVFESVVKHSWHTGDDANSQARPSVCEIKAIAPMYILRTQMGYSMYNLDCLSLSRICDLIERTVQRCQSITYCRIRFDSLPGTETPCVACGQIGKLWDHVGSIRAVDPSGAILFAAGI